MNRANALLLTLTLLAPALTHATETDAPDPELLEFLGEWGDEGDAWLQQQQDQQVQQAQQQHQQQENRSVAAPKTEVKQNDE